MITINAKLLGSALSALDRIVPRKSPREILTSVLVRPETSTLDLLAANMDQWSCIQVGRTDFRDSDPGDPFLLGPPARQFIAKCTGDITLDYDPESRQVTMRAARDRGIFACEDATLFPASEVSWSTDAAVASGPAGEIHAVLDRIGSCICPNSTRYALSGIALTCDNEPGLIGVATDGRRLGIIQTDYHALRWPDNQVAVVPIPFFAAAKAMLQARTETHLFVDANSVRIMGEGAQVWSRLVEGRFPRWRDILPSGHSGVFASPAQSWTDALAKVQIAVRDEDATQGVLVSPDGNLVRISARNPGREIETEIEVSMIDGASPESVVFSPDLLSDGVAGAGDAVRCEWPLDARSPILITSEDCKYRYVLMPLSRE